VIYLETGDDSDLKPAIWAGHGLTVCSPQISNCGTPASSMIEEEIEMPAKRELSMRQLRHLLRLHYDGVRPSG
jgi:hypothetical protein